MLVGTAVAGLGWGPAFLGAYGTIVALARPEDRAGLVAAIFTVGYLAFSIPAVIAGVATSHYGLHKTALVYSSIVAVLAATAAGSVAVRRTRAGRATGRAAAQPELTVITPPIAISPPTGVAAARSFEQPGVGCGDHPEPDNPQEPNRCCARLDH